MEKSEPLELGSEPMMEKSEPLELGSEPSVFYDRGFAFLIVHLFFEEWGSLFYTESGDGERTPKNCEANR